TPTPRIAPFTFTTLRLPALLLLFMAHCQAAECWAQTNLTCFICGLPVNQGFAEAPDGRVICLFDLPKTVLSIDEASRIFKETRAGIRQMCGSALELKQNNIAVNLFDVEYWND